MSASERVERLPALDLGSLSRRRGRTSRFLRFVRRKPLAAMGGLVIVALVVMAVFADQIAPRRYERQDIVSRLEAPSSRFLLGTDDLGRDLLSRIIYGARVSLTVSVGAVAIGLLGGGVCGVLSGYAGGKTDLVLQRVMDGILSIPLLLMAMVIVAALGSSLVNVILAMGVILIPGVNRVARGAVISVKELPFVDAGRSIGATPVRIVLQHVFPNILAPLIVISTINLGSAIITESSLSFLGMGVPPPYPTWGGMLSSTGRTYLQDAPWLAIFPGLAISLTVLAFNLLGDGLRDILDPRLRS